MGNRSLAQLDFHTSAQQIISRVDPAVNLVLNEVVQVRVQNEFEPKMQICEEVGVFFEKVVFVLQLVDNNQKLSVKNVL